MEHSGKDLTFVNSMSQYGEKREWDKTIFDKIVAENFPKLMKDIKT